MLRLDARDLPMTTSSRAAVEAVDRYTSEFLEALPRADTG